MANKDEKQMKQNQPEEKAMPDRTSKIMVKPLPAILDEIEDSINKADDAAADARKAAEEARLAGEKAASEAARVAAQAIARVEAIARAALELSQLLNATLIEASAGIEKKLTQKK